MIRNLKAEGIRVPLGFATTAEAYREFLDANNLQETIERRLRDLRAGAQRLDQVFLFFSKHLSGGSYQPETVHLLPVDKTWLSDVRKKEWPNRCLPLFTMDWDPLFSALILQYLFVSLFRASAESLASENASRLASMQGAEYPGAHGSAHYEIPPATADVHYRGIARHCLRL
jgi:F0F1-type ATP synthase gamma subunit